MGKLSQQLQERGGVQDRTTRTQRVARVQEFEKQKKDFKTLKSQATEKQKEFEGITSIEEYRKKYNLLDPSLKQFFQTPATLQTERTTRIETTKQTIKERYIFADKKIAEAKAKLDHNLAFSRDKYNKENRSREWLGGREQKYENDFDETVEKWKGYKKGLDRGSEQLNKNEDVSFVDINNYASELGRYEESREKARNTGQVFKRDQELERKRLEGEGYEAQVVEKSFKGRPTAVQIGFYNPKTKDWVSSTEYKVKAPIDVSKFERLGYSAPQQRKIEFGGKTIGFQSRVGIYKAPSGEIVTPYEKTGVTEAQLIKQAQDVAFKEWKDKPKPISIPFKIIEGEELPVGYGGQYTISTDPISAILSEKDYYRDVKKFDLSIGKAWERSKAGFDWVKQRVHWDFSIDKSPIAPISVLKFGKVDEPTIIEKAYIKAFEDIETGSQKLEEWVVGKKRIEEFNIGIEKKYQTEYQSKFERRYMEDLIYEKETFEETSVKFAESEEAKILQKKFTKEYGESYRELQIGKGFWKGTVAGGLGQTGLGLGKFWLKATGDPTSATLTTLAVPSGLKVLKAIPPIASTGLMTGLGVYGGIKFLDPSSTYIEKGGGLLTLAIAGATLGYGAYRHFRSPVIKTAKIKAPKQTLKASEVIGKDIKIATDKGMVNKVIFENQKLSQTATAGRRTIVTTKGRELIAKYTKFQPAPIYRGIPTEQLGSIKYYEKFGGLIKIGKQSSYQKALVKLMDYGYTTSQAKATLRYVAPRVTEQYLSKGVLTVKGSKAFGEFEYLTKKPVIDVDKTLGIKTRGGKTIKDVYDVERRLITIDRGKVVSKLVLEQKTRIGFLLKEEGLFKFTEADFSGGVGISKATKKLKGYEYLGKDASGLDIFKKAKYKDVYSISATKKILPADKIVVDASKTKLINKMLDLRKKDYVYTKPIGIKKTPFDFTNKMISSDVSKIINKLDDVGVKGLPTAKIGKTFGGLDPQTSLQLKQQLKVAVLPEPLKVVKLKSLIKIKQLDALSKIDLLQVSTLKEVTGIKTNANLKTELKARNNLKILLKEGVLMKTKTAQLSKLKTSPALKSQLKSILSLSPISPSLLADPIIKMPNIPKMTPPMKPLIILPFLKAEISKRTRKGVRASVYDRAYLPDFTARALGLETEIITEKQANKKLKKLLTGLEIRRGIKVKW